MRSVSGKSRKHRLARVLVATAIGVSLALSPVGAHVRDAHAQDNSNAWVYGIYGGVLATLLVGGVIARRRAARLAAEEAVRQEAEQMARAAEARRVQEANQLAGKDVQSIGLSIENELPNLYPRGTFGLIATAVLADGTQLRSAGAGGGKTQWSDYAIDVISGTFADGAIRPYADPRQIRDHAVMIRAENVHDSNDTATLEIPVTYAVDYHLHRNGEGGPDGDWGRRGAAGGQGADSSDRDGGDGGDGGDGERGQTGGGGAPGQSVLVQVDAIQDPILSKTLLRVVCSGDNQTERYLIDPDGGTLVIHARGGQGGDGGPGGRGGDGGNGGRGSNPGSGSDAYEGTGGNGGDGGDGGQGGDGGRGGDGGAVTVIVDPSARAFRDRIVIDNRGGAGGDGGIGGTAGSPGVGGTASRSGQQGRSGRSGLRGQDGQPGRDGPPTDVRVRSVDLDW
ncbi:MAG: hypothetical protein AAFV53_05140 [Myxococcota bacterium]